MQVSMNISSSIESDGALFFTINRGMSNSPNTFKLVYRSECKHSEPGGVKTWNQVILETETVTEGQDDKLNTTLSLSWRLVHPDLIDLHPCVITLNPLLRMDIQLCRFS